MAVAAVVRAPGRNKIGRNKIVADLATKPMEEARESAAEKLELIRRRDLQRSAVHLQRFATCPPTKPSFCECPETDEDALHAYDAHVTPGKCSKRLCGACHELLRWSCSKKQLRCEACRMPLHDPESYVPPPKRVCGCRFLENGKRMKAGAYCLLPERHRTEIGTATCREPTGEQIKEHKERLQEYNAYSKHIAALRSEYRNSSAAARLCKTL